MSSSPERDDECPVCFEALRTRLRVTPPCNHAVCLACFQRFPTPPRCPTCRLDLAPLLPLPSSPAALPIVVSAAWPRRVLFVGTPPSPDTCEPIVLEDSDDAQVDFEVDTAAATPASPLAAPLPAPPGAGPAPDKEEEQEDPMEWERLRLEVLIDKVRAALDNVAPTAIASSFVGGFDAMTRRFAHALHRRELGCAPPPGWPTEYADDGSVMFGNMLQSAVEEVVGGGDAPLVFAALQDCIAAELPPPPAAPPTPEVIAELVLEETTTTKPARTPKRRRQAASSEARNKSPRTTTTTTAVLLVHDHDGQLLARRIDATTGALTPVAGVMDTHDEVVVAAIDANGTRHPLLDRRAELREAAADDPWLDDRPRSPFEPCGDDVFVSFFDDDAPTPPILITTPRRVLKRDDDDDEDDAELMDIIDEDLVLQVLDNAASVDRVSTELRQGSISPDNLKVLYELVEGDVTEAAVALLEVRDEHGNELAHTLDLAGEHTLVTDLGLLRPRLPEAGHPAVVSLVRADGAVVTLRKEKKPATTTTKKAERMAQAASTQYDGPLAGFVARCRELPVPAKDADPYVRLAPDKDGLKVVSKLGTLKDGPPVRYKDYFAGNYTTRDGPWNRRLLGFRDDLAPLKEQCGVLVDAVQRWLFAHGEPWVRVTANAGTALLRHLLQHGDTPSQEEAWMAAFAQDEDALQAKHDLAQLEAALSSDARVGGRPSTPPSRSRAGTPLSGLPLPPTPLFDASLLDDAVGFENLPQLVPQ